MSLTDATIRALPAPPKGQKIYLDAALKGFGCRVSQGGTKTFLLLLGAQRQKITIGRYPVISLAEARAEAKRLLAEFTLGKRTPQSITFSQAVELFLADKAQSRRPSTVKAYRTKLNRYGFKCKLTGISPTEAARRLNKITASSERSHVLVAGKVFFNWCIKRRYLSENPLFGLAKPHCPPRDRVLTQDEIRRLWSAQGAFADYCKLLLLTGQRRSELRQATVKVDRLIVPASVAKNGRESVIPLTALARSYLQPFPDFDWGRAKAKLDRAIGIAPWTLHDLRRTCATNLAELGVPPYVVERLLNHVTGTISGVAAIYNRYSFLEEMRAAIELWEGRLRSLTAMQHAA